MTPNDFITKWRASELKERSASQEHFIDLCRLLGEPTPADADPTGETYLLRHALPAPARFGELAGELFRAMASGGRVGFETVAWFNGSLFNDATTLPVERTDIETVLAAADLDWSEILPPDDGAG